MDSDKGIAAITGAARSPGETTTPVRDAASRPALAAMPGVKWNAAPTANERHRQTRCEARTQRLLAAGSRCRRTRFSRRFARISSINSPAFLGVKRAKARWPHAGDLKPGNSLTQLSRERREHVRRRRRRERSAAFLSRPAAQFEHQVRAINAIRQAGAVQPIECPADRLAVRHDQIELVKPMAMRAVQHAGHHAMHRQRRNGQRLRCCAAPTMRSAAAS